VAAYADAFAAKYSPVGVPAWVRKVGGSGVEHGLAVGVDRTTGAVWLGGTSTTAALPFGFGTHTNAGGTDGFYVKLHADGTWNAGRPVASPLDDAVRAIAVSPAGKAVIGGQAGPGAYAGFTVAGGTDGFVEVVNLLVSQEWLSGVHATGNDSVNAVGFRPDGSVAFAGQVAGSNTVGASFSSLGPSDAIVGTIPKAGGLPTMKPTGGFHDDTATAMVVDPTDGQLEVAGWSVPPASIAGVPVGTGGGGSDGWVFHFRPEWGTIDGVIPTATGSGNGKPLGVVLTGTSYGVVGLFSGSASFGSSPSTVTLTAAGSNDGFLFVA
jgi:hypothetical protein